MSPLNVSAGISTSRWRGASVSVYMTSVLTVDSCRDSLPVCLDNENPNRLVSLWDMYQFYAHVLLKLFDELRDLEIQLNTKLASAPPTK
jgi:hypothetical protein